MQLFIADKTFYKKTLAIAIPISMQSMTTIGVNLMDTMMIGTLGEIGRASGRERVYVLG